MIGKLVLPGDTVQNPLKLNGVVILGPGLRRHIDEEKILVTRPGILNFKAPNVYWIEGHLKRYIPKKGELIVGIIQAKRGDILKVDIRGSEYASLSLYAFEGATKKQKPDVNIGDVVYARLLSSNREMEPELVCVDSYYKAGKLGVLSNEGFVFNVSTEYAQELLDFQNPLLRTLGKKSPFEIAIGLNGRIWLKAKSVEDVFTIHRVLLEAERMSANQIIDLCRRN